MTAGATRFFSLEGRCACRRRGGRGMGKAVVRALAEAGARVACADIQEPKGVPADGLALTSDFSTETAAEEAVGRVASEFGALHIVVNCMGILVPNRQVDETPLKEFQRAFAVNAAGVFLMCKHAARQMIALGTGGLMTNITSLAEPATLPNQSAYTASKGALASLTRSLALDWGPYGIRVKSIAPGPVETPMNERFYADAAVKNKLVGRIPLGQPDDIAGPLSSFRAPPPASSPATRWSSTAAGALANPT